MKVFVWEYIENLTCSYHSGGGLVVFAENIERAMELAIENSVKFADDETPDDVRTVDGGEEAIFIFADAGCC